MHIAYYSMDNITKKRKILFNGEYIFIFLIDKIKMQKKVFGKECTENDARRTDKVYERLLDKG